MMTKKEFAESIVQEFCKQEGYSRYEAVSHIYESSRLAVALEFLGELTDLEEEYSKSRCGTEYRYIVSNEKGEFEDLHILSTRELLNLLSD